MTSRKFDWDLTTQERELLKRDCRDSGVTVAVKDQQAIAKVVSLITKSGGDRRSPWSLVRDRPEKRGRRPTRTTPS
jgi:hypothetical protein